LIDYCLRCGYSIPQIYMKHAARLLIPANTYQCCGGLAFSIKIPAGSILISKNDYCTHHLGKEAMATILCRLDNFRW
jgi:hypothetical protein